MDIWHPSCFIEGCEQMTPQRRLKREYGANESVKQSAVFFLMRFAFLLTRTNSRRKVAMKCVPVQESIGMVFLNFA
jgi:hypothetical protein